MLSSANRTDHLDDHPKVQHAMGSSGQQTALLWPVIWPEWEIGPRRGCLTGFSETRTTSGSRIGKAGAVVSGTAGGLGFGGGRDLYISFGARGNGIIMQRIRLNGART